MINDGWTHASSKFKSMWFVSRSRYVCTRFSGLFYPVLPRKLPQVYFATLKTWRLAHNIAQDLSFERYGTRRSFTGRDCAPSKGIVRKGPRRCINQTGGCPWWTSEILWMFVPFDSVLSTRWILLDLQTMISRILRDLSIIFDILVRNFFTPYRITLTCASVLQNLSRANSQFKWNMTWMNKVRSHCHSLSFLFPLLRQNLPRPRMAGCGQRWT